MWQPAADGAPTWADDSAQTLLFERNGVRTTISTRPEADGPSLFVVADSMAAAD
jgi:hypothetical protein